MQNYGQRERPCVRLGCFSRPTWPSGAEAVSVPRAARCNRFPFSSLFSLLSCLFFLVEDHGSRFLVHHGARPAHLSSPFAARLSAPTSRPLPSTAQPSPKQGQRDASRRPKPGRRRLQVKRLAERTRRDRPVAEHERHRRGEPLDAAPQRGRRLPDPPPGASTAASTPAYTSA